MLMEQLTDGKNQVALVFSELSTELRDFLSDSGVLEVVGSIEFSLSRRST